MARRSYGTGSLYVKAGSWYGRWWIGDRRVKRKLAPVRQAGSREGLTKSQAERELRRRIEREKPLAPVGGRLTLEQAGERYIHHLEHVIGRKPSTVQDYGFTLRRHLVPHFGERSLERITADDVRAYIRRKSREVCKGRKGYARQSILNQLNLLSGIFGYAVKCGWAPANPVAMVEKPRSAGRDPEIRYLEEPELEALLRGVPDRGVCTHRPHPVPGGGVYGPPPG
jgi:integrase